MQKKGPLYVIFIIMYMIISCKNEKKDFVTSYNFSPPVYDSLQIIQTSDTIHFRLDSLTYNKIANQNYFTASNIPYIALYDDLSASINIYNFHTKNLVKRLEIKKLLPGSHKRKIVAYVINFDSIVIVNNKAVYLVDSSGNWLSTLSSPPELKDAWADIENTAPPLVKNNHIYTTVSPFVEETSLEKISKWKTICDFDLTNKNVHLLYPLPPVYQKNILGYHFLEYSHCYNKSGNFVFSFPADTLIYETDLSSFNNAYYGKSRAQNKPIKITKKDSLNDKRVALKEYLLNDSYSSIYYDSYNDRYLRVVRYHIQEDQYDNWDKERTQHVLIFDNRFRIIGESPVDISVKLKQLVVTPHGNLYARVNVDDNDVIHLVRLTYQGNSNNQLAIKTK